MSMDNLVGLEEGGSFIYSLITKNAMNNIFNETVTLEIQKLAEEATKEFYEKNTIEGCTNPSSDNFDKEVSFGSWTNQRSKRVLQASVDDGSCKRDEQVSVVAADWVSSFHTSNALDKGDGFICLSVGYTATIGRTKNVDESPETHHHRVINQILTVR